MRSAMALGGIGTIDLLQPIRGAARQQQNRTSATQHLALACARLRLGRLLRDLQEDGARIDGALLLPAREGLWDDIFQDAQLDAGGALPTVLLRLRSPAEDATRQISWRPDLDDVAALRAAIAFAEQPALTLRISGEPGLRAFCAGPDPEPEPVPAALAPLASHLQRTAAAALDHGLAPDPLDSWAQTWGRAVDAASTAGDSSTAEELALAGAAVCGQAAALTALAPLKAEWLSQYLDALWSMVWGAFRASGATTDEPFEDTAAGIARSTAAHYPAHLRLGATDRVLLPSGEGRIWSVYGADAPDDAHLGGEAVGDVISRLLTLQPDAAGHLRCIAYGPGAATLLIEQAVALAGRRIGRAVLRNIEIFCVEEGGWRPSPKRSRKPTSISPQTASAPSRCATYPPCKTPGRPCSATPPARQPRTSRSSRG